MLLQSLQERAGSLRGVGFSRLQPWPSRQIGALSLLFPPLLTSHFISLSNTHTKQQQNLDITLKFTIYSTTALCSGFFFFHLVSSGLVGQHAHVSFGSCKRVHSRTDRSGQSRASSLRGSSVETQQTRL